MVQYILLSFKLHSLPLWWWCWWWWCVSVPVKVQPLCVHSLCGVAKEKRNVKEEKARKAGLSALACNTSRHTPYVPLLFSVLSLTLATSRGRLRPTCLLAYTLPMRSKSSCMLSFLSLSVFTPCPFYLSALCVTFCLPSFSLGSFLWYVDWGGVRKGKHWCGG